MVHMTTPTYSSPKLTMNRPYATSTITMACGNRPITAEDGARSDTFATLTHLLGWLWRKGVGGAKVTDILN